MATAGMEPRRLDPDACKVHVFGYPSYTQPQDLTRAFINFGNVQVDKINQKFASLVFSNPVEARSALESSNKVSIYGTLLTVKAYDPALPESRKGHQNSPKRAFTKTKESEEIINPKDINLSGDFHQQLDNILAAVRLTQEEVTAISTLYSDLQAVLQSLWPGCEALPFGSIPTGLGIKSSDADCFINLPAHFRNPCFNHVLKTQRILRQFPGQFAEILCIPRANTPLVKFLHVRTGTRCDVSFKTPLGTRNSALVAFLLRSDPRVLPLAVLAKYWARVHRLSGSGRLSNYTLVLLVIGYLQRPCAALLPSVRWLQRDVADRRLVDHWDTGFKDSPLPIMSTALTLPELLGGFFEYYSTFNFEDMIVCPYLGEPVRKDVFKDLDNLPEEFDRYKSNVQQQLTASIRFTTPMCVQDPFEQSHNVASSISTRLADEIKVYFKFAADAYEKEKTNNCEKFLETILLQRPKIVKAKGNPEFRCKLFPNMVKAIADPDWKAGVRDTVFIIFEQMLRIKLGKLEDKPNTDSRKEREKYVGSLMNPIWRRKQFSKLYSVVHMDLRQKQTRITDEIMNADKERVNVTFHATLTFRAEPRSAVVAVKMAGGDVLAFREFGRFLVTVLQGWFQQLVRPQGPLAPSLADTVRHIDDRADSEDSDDSDDSGAAPAPA